VHAVFGTERFSPTESERIQRMGSPAAPFEKLLDGGDKVRDAKPASMRASPIDDDADGTSFRALNRIALRLQSLGCPQPLTVAWALAVLELAGSVGVLIGLFTRVFAVPLALAGALTLWTSAGPGLGSWLPWTWGVGPSQIATAWLAGTLMAVSLAMLGAGRPSVDAFLAKGGKPGGKPGGPKPGGQPS
jgi:uncharacterized membrane protein YphA (DoxX/SURF4 family)